jgi:hypothetical protein
MQNPFKTIARPSSEEQTQMSEKALQAAERAATKLREQKRLLGHKLVIVENGEIKTVSP